MLKRFTQIINNLNSMDRSLRMKKRFEVYPVTNGVPKATVIEDAQDLTTFPLDDLVGN